jgi:hypothetical protein
MPEVRKGRPAGIAPSQYENATQTVRFRRRRRHRVRRSAVVVATDTDARVGAWLSVADVALSGDAIEIEAGPGEHGGKVRVWLPVETKDRLS